MDYKDYASGKKPNNFWFRAKREMLDILIRQCAIEEGTQGLGKRQGRKKLDILVVGGGTGEDLKVFMKYGKVSVVDVDRKALRMIPASLKVEKHLADATKLPFKPRSFDLVVSADVFEHIKDHGKAAAEAYRVLRKGGWLVFSVPAFKFLYSSHDRALGHERRYTKPMLSSLFSKFRLVRLSYWNSTSFIPAFVVRTATRNAKPAVDPFQFPEPLNSLILTALRTENLMLKNRIPLPPGVSIAGYCRK